jgi:O-acetyl-ADP-ribose deacetylase (regulator of RNase III)
MRYVKGDLLNGQHKVIVQGCNCLGAFGAGLALQIKKKYPNVYDAYSLRHRVFGLNLGEIIPVQTLDGKVIINAITQQNVGSHTRQVDYNAVEECFIKINNKVEDWEVDEISLPRIGAGLGGGDWNIIESIINKTATNYTPVVYDYEP